VYKIDLSHLRAYANPDTPDVELYHFERESMIRMLAKGKSLTLYEPGPQYISPGLQRTRSEPMPTTHNTSCTTPPPTIYWPTVSMLPPAGSFRTWNGSGATQVDFRMPYTEATRIAGTPPKVPPDGGTTTVLSSMVHDIIVQPIERLSGDIQSMAIVTQQKMVIVCQHQIAMMRSPLGRAWRDFKGVTAIAVASL
jgi:hypothetical protein